jgi:signal transduction histidine kinase
VLILIGRERWRGGSVQEYLERWRRYGLLGDVLLALSIFGLSVAAVASGAGDCDCSVTAWAYVAAAGQTLPLVARRSAPFAVNLLVAPSAIIAGLAAWPALPAPLGALVAIHAAAAYARRWQAYVVLGAALAAVPLALLPRDAPTSLVEVAHTWLVVGVAWLLGDAGRYRRTALVEARRREAMQQRLRTAEAASAVAEERARIAREMHDLLTHSVSVMVVLAEGGAASASTGKGGAVGVFEAIAGRGRRTLDELRGTLGVLRGHEQASAATPPDQAALQPLPGFGDLPGLIAAMREAGVAVRLRGHASRPVSPIAGLAVYRIVQEALTNALKHAPGSPVEVQIVEESSRLRVRVVNPFAEAADGAKAAAVASGAGHGLRGMRERAATVGGRLCVDHDARQWVVELAIPVEGDEVADPSAAGR